MRLQMMARVQLDATEARKIKKNSSKFTMIDGELYRFGFIHPLLECVHGEKCTRIMAELHEGICGSHVRGRALAARTLRAGYYWPKMREDCKKYAQCCKQCQQHADWHKAPPEELSRFTALGRFIHGESTSWDHARWRSGR